MMMQKLSSSPSWLILLANFIASTPLILGFLVWIASLSSLSRLAVGFLLGFLCAALLHLLHLHRSHLRRTNALNNAQLCQLDVNAFFPASVPNWLSEKSVEHEKVKWFNRVLEEVWPFLNEAVSGMLKMILQSVLDPYKFSIIQNITIKSITLGTLNPHIDGVKFSSGDENEAVLEVKLDWQHTRDAKIVIQLHTTGPLLTVQIKDFVIFGLIKLVFKPLTEQFPGFGAVTLSLLEPPIVDFQTKFLGGNILAIPGVDNVLDNIILTALADLLVWPNRLVIPILPGDYSDLMLKPIGRLQVELVEAQNLAKGDIWGESDPYAVIYIRRKQGCICTSSTMKNTKAPVWNETFFLDVEDIMSQRLTIQLFDYDLLKPHDFLGLGEFPLIGLEADPQADIWIDLRKDLKNMELRSEGRVHLRIHYKSLSVENEHS